jgi:hypothetical protein
MQVVAEIQSFLRGDVEYIAAEFSKFRQLLENGDREAMRKIMRDAGARRTLFDKK